MNNRICNLFGITHPIVSGGMVWCSGWKLASAVSEAGGLGLLGAGSMHPETLEEHIIKLKRATDKPFGVNVPLLYPEIEKLMDIIVAQGVKVVFTSAGSPKKWTPFLKEHGVTVVHVVSSAFFAKKCEDAGVDAVVAEGFEAGGHNGREETTTMALIPSVRKAISIPLISAGGISSGGSVAAALALGAEGVQIGSLFALSAESSAHDNFKQLCIDSKEGATKLAMKQMAPVRLLKNSFADTIHQEEAAGAPVEKLREILGKGRAKVGMFEGDLEEGELEIGQVSSYINSIESVDTIFKNILEEYKEAQERLSTEW